METKETDKRGTALERTYTKGLTAYGKKYTYRYRSPWEHVLYGYAVCIL